MKSVDAYIDQLSGEKRETCILLRKMILEMVPGIEERLSFKIPFYHYYGMFVYLNETAEGIDVGFCRGRDLAVAFPQLQMKARAIVATVCINNRKDILRYDLAQLIPAAAAWNKEARQLKLPMVKKASSPKKQRLNRLRPRK